MLPAVLSPAKELPSASLRRTFVRPIRYEPRRRQHTESSEPVSLFLVPLFNY